MADRKDGDGKPFYQNIVDSRKRHVHPPKGNKAAGGRSSSGDEGSSPRGVGPHARDGRPGNANGPAMRSSPPDGRPDRGGDRVRDGRPGSSSGPSPRAGQGPSAKPGQGAWQGSVSRRDLRDRRDQNDGRNHSGRDVPGSDPRRPGQDSRSGSAPRGEYDGRAPSRGDAPLDSARPRGGKPFHDAKPSREGGAARARRPYLAPKEFAPVFGEISKETKELLSAFPDIVQSVIPLDSKRLLELPARIRELSHELTDERSDRRVGYLNDPAELSAYIRYYMWWNLVRLTRLFATLPLELGDGDAAVDLGSGPLTLPIALWMARPDLRAKKITWFCVDISPGALSAGEEIFLSLAARTGDEPWQIVRVKGECGVSLRRKVSLVASANMFNELFWDNPLPLEAQAKHHASGLASYADSEASVLVVEPGVPRAGRFVSLLRDSLLRLGFSVAAPCPHEGTCPFPGLRYGKWCHFAFDTADAPERLHRLSDEANLAKDRAALSFIFSKRTIAEPPEGESAETGPDRPDSAPAAAAAPAPVPADSLGTVKRLSGMFHGLRVRITSDPIKLPDYFTGRYGCSELGMVLVMGTYQAADWLKTCASGSLIEVSLPDKKNPEYDSKTGALIVRLK